MGRWSQPGSPASVRRLPRRAPACVDLVAQEPECQRAVEHAARTATRVNATSEAKAGESRDAASRIRTGNTGTASTWGAKNSACTVKANPPVSAQLRARSDHACTCGSSQHDRPAQQQAGRDLREAEGAGIAEEWQHRHRRRDGGQRRQRVRRSSGAARRRCSPAMPRSMHRPQSAFGAERHPGDAPPPAVSAPARSARGRRQPRRASARGRPGYSPCSPPQSTNCHAAPCHSPRQQHGRIRLPMAPRSPRRLPPSGIYR